MKFYKILLAGLFSIITLSMVVSSCQKLDRPPLGPIIEDPTPPPYNALKSYWQFENNLTDEGENKLTASSTNLTYVPGISGQAAKIGADGYMLLTGMGDT